MTEDCRQAVRMNAYYYGFKPTGVIEVDRILSAVAWAGKAFHHTDCWTDKCSPYDGVEGETPIDWIQNAANKAAEAYQAGRASIPAPEVTEESLKALKSADYAMGRAWQRLHFDKELWCFLNEVVAENRKIIAALQAALNGRG